MNVEILEFELSKLNGKPVVVIRPNFGTQSDSFRGTLRVGNNAYPMTFEVSFDSQSTIFKATDVVKIDNSPTDFNTPAVKIIRLKGPHDYQEAYQLL